MHAASAASLSESSPFFSDTAVLTTKSTKSEKPHCPPSTRCSKVQTILVVVSTIS